MEDIASFVCFFLVLWLLVTEKAQRESQRMIDAARRTTLEFA